jgi:glyoxylase-like metal-dependent hydrolase (beta-lactamase superfamily II)/rhodanese-related sulfurtransferase
MNIRELLLILILVFAVFAVKASAVEKESEDGVKNVDTQGLLNLQKEFDSIVYLDVRTALEIDQSGGTLDVPRNINIPAGWVAHRFADRVRKLDTPIVVFCGTNQRSPVIAAYLQEKGYKNVWNYESGFIAWQAEGMPVKGDSAPESMLYQLPEQVTENVWSAIGATAPGSYFNSGHNNNLSFIITSQGVVVVNAGDNYLLAKALHDEIKLKTDQPVKYVILENGQGHAMLGSNYWQEQGAKVIAHVDTAHEIEELGHDVYERMKLGRRDKSKGTKLTMPDITFEEDYLIKLGDEVIEVKNLGPAHSPGDVVVWLPKQKLVISGDVAFHERLLPVFEVTDTDGWIETWDAFVGLGAEIIIPGHGGPTNYVEVTKYTHDYLVFMREKLGEVIDNGGTLEEAYLIDQAPYQHLDTFYELARRNAGRIFQEMEFEF